MPRRPRSALLCAALAVSSQLAWSQTALNSGDVLVERREARAWLSRIQDAAQKRNYQGTVIVSAGGTVSSSRIHHQWEGRHQFERIDALDGQPRSVVRQDDQVHTVWPERRVAMVEQRDQMSSFPALVQAGGERIPEFYDLKPAGQERVAGREAHILVLRAKDAHRYGYRLWADRATGLLLRAETVGEGGKVLESSAFSEVTVGAHHPVDTLLQPIKRLDGFKVSHPVVMATRLNEEGWVLKNPVAGFTEVSCVKRPGDNPLRPVATAAPMAPEQPLLQSVYSDGLTSVSIFIEAYQSERHTRPLQATLGATQTLTRRHADWWVTLMGDVPASTLRTFADALERRTGAPLSSAAAAR